MGRIQRKKPVSKKKKKQRNASEELQPQVNDASADKKVVSLTDFSKTKKAQPAPRKKISAGGRLGEEDQGHVGKALQFLREVKVELKKVTWPSRNQTIGSTVVVILIVMIISLFLGLVDIGLSNLVRIVLH